jgi:hypothetical protein
MIIYLYMRIFIIFLRTGQALSEARKNKKQFDDSHKNQDHNNCAVQRKHILLYRQSQLNLVDNANLWSGNDEAIIWSSDGKMPKDPKTEGTHY